uniref:Secretory phospholipase A2 receptor-like n=1 Tax=Acanthochromis polyacanthus TaxID=80966 RepID=A0A3Q1F4C5_9TELE
MENADDMSQVESLLSSSGYTSGIWFGLYSKINWKWSDGLTLSGAEYQDWRHDEPVFAMGQFCSYLNEYWITTKCGSERPSICYKGTQENREFVGVSKAMNFSEAQKYCRENYVDLATVTNAIENKQAKAQRPQRTPAWMGLFRDPELYWSDGSSFSWSNFGSGETKIRSITVICGFTSLKTSMKWRMGVCEDRKPFVCQLTVTRQVVKLRIDVGDSSVDLNDPAVKAEILK